MSKLEFVGEIKIKSTEEIVMDGMIDGAPRQEIWDNCYIENMPFFIKKNLEEEFDKIIRRNIEKLRKFLKTAGIEPPEEYFASLLKK